jgi:energy-coupling factor transporter ATP-binding protein EcfA2
MTLATRTKKQSPALHVADSHDLIRVHGAPENNLKDVIVEIPKRRLTVFAGVSGSGKSSLVFDTIAAKSQRLINETYSAFVQGFMPTLARPEVDALEGLTTAIIVDKQRVGANPRASSSAGSANRLSARVCQVRRPNNSASVVAMASSMATPIASGSKYRMDHPPCSKPRSVSSFRPPGAWTTPSRLMKSLMTMRISAPCVRGGQR